MFVDALQDVVLQTDLQLTKLQTVRSPTDILWALQDSEAGAEFARLVFPGNGIPRVPALQKEAGRMVIRHPGPAGSGSPQDVSSYPHLPVSPEKCVLIISKNE